MKIKWYEIVAWIAVLALLIPFISEFLTGVISGFIGSEVSDAAVFSIYGWTQRVLIAIGTIALIFRMRD